MVLTDIRKKLNEVEHEISTVFSNILAKHSEIELWDEFDIENGDTPDDYFDYRNDISGNVIEVHVLKVDIYGVHVIESKDTTQKHVIKFSDLDSTLDRINLCELMESVLKF